MKNYSDYSMDELKDLAKYLAKDHSAKLVKFWLRLWNDQAVVVALLRYKNGTEGEASILL